VSTRHYQAIPLPIGQDVVLDEIASHHLGNVLRAKAGDEVILFNGDGAEVMGHITAIRKKQVVVQLIKQCAPVVESPLALHLAIAIGKGERMDWIMQKATELGATHITPLMTDYVNVRLDAERSDKKREHWERICISAAEQSGRVRVPTLHPILSLPDWLSHPREGLTLMLHPGVTQTFHDLPDQESQIHLLIGPEGGFSDPEVKLARDHHVTQVSFGPRILRMETAAMAAITASQLRWGDL
jgi:16S rRNA (uracil1498-N3)-methyltransferase